MHESTSYPTVRLDELVDVLDHLRAPVNGEERARRAGTVPYYGANGQQGWIDKPLTSEPLILLAEDGGNFDAFAERPIAYRIDGPAWVNNHAHIIRAKRGVSQSFVFWSIAHKDIRQFIAGGTRTKLTQGELRRIEVQTPGESERKKIAQVLDTLDATIRKTEAIIEKLQQVKRGMLHDLLTRGIDDNGELQPPQNEASHLYKESVLGWIPSEWSTRALGQVLDRIMDYRGRTPKKLGMDWGGGDILALSANNVQMGAIDLQREAYYGSDRLYSRWMTNGDPQKGDLLLTLEAPLGNVAQVPDNSRYILSQRVILIRFDETLVANDFAYWQLIGEPFQQAMAQQSTGTTATGIQRAKLELIPFVVPPLAEQLEINLRLRSMQSRIDAEQGFAQKLLQEKVGLMDDLLTGRVPVTPLLGQ